MELRAFNNLRPEQLSINQSDPDYPSGDPRLEKRAQLNNIFIFEKKSLKFPIR